MSAKSEQRYRNEEWLREQCEKQNVSPPKIARMCETSHATVQRWLTVFDIETRFNEDGSAAVSTYGLEWGERQRVRE